MQNDPPSSPTGDDSTKDDEQFRRALGQRIRQARDTAQMKQESAAREVGVAAATFSRWEQGHFAPNLEKLCRLAQVLGVSLDALCGLSQTPSPRSAIVDRTNLAALEAAAKAKAPLATLASILQPPTVGVAFIVPVNMQIVPPNQVPALLAHVESMVSKLS
jgi:transcriptional regulator with XRE-family HTH domain